VVWKVDTRGVDNVGKGMGVLELVRRVMVEGVRAFSVGEGGKTKRVCEGVCREEIESVEEAPEVLLSKLFRTACNGGGGKRRDSIR